MWLRAAKSMISSEIPRLCLMPLRLRNLRARAGLILFMASTNESSILCLFHLVSKSHGTPSFRKIHSRFFRPLIICRSPRRCRFLSDDGGKDGDGVGVYEMFEDAGYDRR